MPSIVSTFKTSGAIKISSSSCLVVIGILHNSGASSNIIHRKVVQRLRLEPLKVAPQTFNTAAGHKIAHDELVYVRICIAGVWNEICAYVDDSASDLLMIIGRTGLKQFRTQHNFAYGVGENSTMRVTVSPDITGQRRIRYMVQEDGPGEKPRMLTSDPTVVRSRAYEVLRGRTSKEVESMD